MSGTRRPSPALLLGNLLFTFVVPGSVAVLGPLALAPAEPPDDVWLVLALPVLTLGTAIYFWCVWDFATAGRGTPAPVAAPRHLVVRGLYRWVRNPMYLGVLSIVAGWAIRFRSRSILLYALAVWAVFHTFTIAYEEPALRRLFGEEYRRYTARVGRWIPRPPGPPDPP